VIGRTGRRSRPMKVSSLKVYLASGNFERKAAAGETFNVKIEGSSVTFEDGGRLTRFVGAPFSVSYEKPAEMTDIDFK
jgi:hypothetical protein